jgi:hypothetical protein
MRIALRARRDFCHCDESHNGKCCLVNYDLLLRDEKIISLINELIQ